MNQPGGAQAQISPARGPSASRGGRPMAGIDVDLAKGDSYQLIPLTDLKKEFDDERPCDVEITAAMDPVVGADSVGGNSGAMYGRSR